MNLIAKQGRNQQGLCFVSAHEPDCEPGLYEINYSGHTMFIDIRRSLAVTDSMLILDNRIFTLLGCDDGSSVRLRRIKHQIPTCRELELTVASTKSLDNNSVSEAVSQRVDDLQEVFDGLVLTRNQRISLDRLGLEFTVRSLSPMDTESDSCRLIWNELKKVHLEPATKLPVYNLVCAIELGAAAHITDIHRSSTDDESDFVPRYFAAIELLSQLAISYPRYDAGSQFSGLVYSDEVVAFPIFDPETGDRVEASFLYSKSVLESYRKWVHGIASTHRSRPSNPGAALNTAIDLVSNFSESTEFPTIVAFFSSGMHSSGPDPLNALKKKVGWQNVPLLCFCLGKGSNMDVLQAAAEFTKGLAIEITHMKQVIKINEWIAELLRDRG